jgi:hypothetical protein
MMFHNLAVGAGNGTGNFERNAGEKAGQNSLTPERKTNHDLCAIAG